MNILDAATAFCGNTANIWRIIGYVVLIVKIAVPIVLIVLGMLDLGKASFAGEEKEIKAAQSMLIKRIIYGVLIFFVTTIVTAVMSLIGQNSKGNVCFQCLNSPSKENGACKKANVCLDDGHDYNPTNGGSCCGDNQYFNYDKEICKDNGSED